MARILIVDDEKAFRVMLRGMLDALGHETVEAADGLEAESLFACGGIDLVLMDIIMPGQDGVVTIKHLRHDHPGVKIVGISGGGMVSASEYLRTAKHLGVNAIMEKPLGTDELQAMIELQLGPGKSSGK